MCNDTEPSPIVLSNAAATAVVAGSDTTATALSNTLYFILSHPACHARLQAEVDTTFPLGQGDPVDFGKLAQMEYLNAVINESLRLLPPLLTCLQRAPEPGSGGHMIGTSHFIPEGTAVYVPPYVLHRDPRYFSPAPDAFRPERWLAANDDDDEGKGKSGDGDDKSSGAAAAAVLNTNAYIPFSTGPANCAGRPLALMELRMVLAYVLQTFEVSFAEGYDARRWEEEMRDYFLTQKGALPVALKLRSAAV